MLDEFGVTEDHGDHIVEIVCDTSRQPADCLHFLRLHQLGMQQFAFRLVIEDENNADGFAPFIADRRPAVRDRTPNSIFRDQRCVVCQSDNDSLAKDR